MNFLPQKIFLNKTGVNQTPNWWSLSMKIYTTGSNNED